MKENKVDILVLQETKSPQNKRETRKDYTWYFSGNGSNKCEHGVAIIVKNQLTRHIIDIEPINERLMYITLDSTLPINIINTYIPTSVASADDKEKTYTNLQNIYDKLKNKGPTYILGGFNARTIYPTNSTEEEVIGKHTMYDTKDEGKTTLIKFTAGMHENRDLFMQFAISNNLKVMNTKYKNTHRNISNIQNRQIVRQSRGIHHKQNTCTNILHTYRRKMEKLYHRYRITHKSKHKLRPLPTSTQNQHKTKTTSKRRKRKIRIQTMQQHTTT